MRRFWKFTNTFICIDLPNQVVDEINRNDHSGLQIIHLFVFDPENIKLRSLMTFGGMCRRREKKLIVHCANKRVLAEMRKKLKGVYKNTNFHLSLLKKHGITFKPAQGLMLTVLPDGRVFEQDGTMANAMYCYPLLPEQGDGLQAKF